MLQRWDRLPHTLPARETVFPIRNRQGMFRGLPTLENICQNTVHSTHSAGTAERNLERGGAWLTIKLYNIIYFQR